VGTLRSSKHVTAAAVVLAGFGAMAEAAVAAVEATQTGSQVTVTGDAAANTIGVARSGGTSTVTGVTSETAADCTLDVPTSTLSCTNAVNSIIVNAGDGADVLTGAVAALHGQGGNDVLNAGGSAPTSQGFSSDDDGGAGNDTFNGGPGSDFFVAEEGADVYRGGTTPDPTPLPAGFEPGDAERADTVSYGARTAPVSVSADGVANDGEAGEGDDVGSDVEGLTGGTAADVLTAAQTNPAGASLEAREGDDVVTGSPFSDYLQGNDGTDTLVAGAGSDTLYDGDFTPSTTGGSPPAAGNDKLDGGPGDDYLSTDRGADDVVGGDGEDTADFSYRIVSQAPSYTGPDVFADLAISLDDVANDGAGDGDNVRTDVEVVNAGPGNDTLVGSARANQLVGGQGNDTITGGGGADLLNAGRGNDTVNAVDQTADNVSCSDGTDVANVDAAGGQPGKEDQTTGCETVNGTPLIAVMPLADVAKPVLRFRGATVTKVRTFLRTFTLSQRVNCGEPCSIAGEIRLSGGRAAAVGDLIIGTGSLRSGAGERTLRAKVARKYQQALRRKLRTRTQRRKGIVLQLRLQATDGAGNVTTTTRRLRVRG
jgi:Ca2+-binding RTX toxin-like protein